VLEALHVRRRLPCTLSGLQPAIDLQVAVRRALPSLVVASVALLFAETASAQVTPAEPTPAEPTPAPPANAPIPEVSVIGDRADAIQKTPGSTFLIGSKDLKAADPVDLAEMLRRVPGVTSARQDYGGGSRLDVSIRGLDPGRSRRVLMLEDGIPLSLNPYNEPDMYFGPAIERYRAIEVVKGSGNILFGPQTLAGTINFVTILPPERQSVVFDLDAGNYGYARGLARYGDTIGEARYVVQVVERRGNGFRGQDFNTIDTLGKVIVPTGKDGQLVVRLSYHRDDSVSEDLGLTPAMWRIDPRRATLVPADRSILNRYDAAFIHEQTFSAQTKLTTLVYAYETDRIWRRQDFTRSPQPGESYDTIVGDPATPGAAVYLKNTNVVLDRWYTVMGVEPRAQHRMATGPVGHTFEVGGRVLRELAHYQQRAGTYPESFAGANVGEEKHIGTAFSGHIQDRMAFTDKLLVTPGVRYEHVESNRTILRQGTTDVFQSSDQAVNGLVPGIGMTYGTKTASVFGGVHLGFAPPRVAAASSPNGIPTAVHAEQSMDYEAGTRLRPAKWLRFEGTGFLSNFSNQVVSTNAGTGGADTILADAGATNILGVETSGTLGLNQLFDVPTLIEIGAQYTLSRATFRYGTNAGHLLPYAPEHTASAHLDVEHRTGIGGQLAWAYIGKQFTDAANTRAEDVAGLIGLIDPVHIIDATAHYRHKPSGITLRLTAKNLLDTTYIQARRPNGIFPGPFRQIFLGLRWEWERKPSE
jgi:Fe(3+) dicitrate transport protein